MKLPHIPCEEAAVNVEKSLWQRLNFVTWMKTRWHLYLCENCQEYEKDSKALHRILCTLKKKKNVEPLNTEEKNKLKKALD